MSNEIWWRVYVFRQGENKTQLNRQIRKLHRTAPEVDAGHIGTLNSRKRKVVVPGKGGYELTLTRGETKTIDGGMHYQIFVDFTHKAETATGERPKRATPAVRERGQRDLPSILERRKWDSPIVVDLGQRDPQTIRELGQRDATVPAAAADDYGLAEFDRISSSLAHSAPVAEAIRAIQREEVEFPDWRQQR